MESSDKTVQELKQKIAELEKEINQKNQKEKSLDKQIKKLQESEERFRSLVENTSDCFWETDENAIITYISPNIKDLLGYTIEEIQGKTTRHIRTPAETKRVNTIFKRLCEAKKPFTGLESTNIHKDGHTVILETSGMPVFNKDGSLSGFRGIDRDITEKKKMEEELLKSKKLESIGFLAGGIAHDFNNLLTAILGNLSMAQMQVKPDDKVYKLLVQCENASLQAAELATKLITFSKGGWLVKKKLSLQSIFNSMGNINLSNVEVSLDYDIPPNLPSIYGDEDQLQQVFQNIFINSAESARDGSIYILVKAERTSVNSTSQLPLNKGIFIRVSISDNGKGINSENLHQIFDPYFSTKVLGNQKGMGLGLAICYSIIKKHNGHITVESEPGQGTTINIYLPIYHDEAYQLLGDEELVGTMQKGKILFMDDESFVIEITNRMLEELGYQVEGCEEGSEALSLYKKAKEIDRPFDAVILDIINKKGMEGKETLKNLLKINPDIKAIAVSGYLKTSDFNKLRDAGFCEVIQKPYKLSQLEEILNRILDHND